MAFAVLFTREPRDRQRSITTVLECDAVRREANKVRSAVPPTLIDIWSKLSVVSDRWREVEGLSRGEHGTTQPRSTAFPRALRRPGRCHSPSTSALFAFCQAFWFCWPIRSICRCSCR